MIRLHEKIRQILDSSRHLTQRGLAERMGLDPAAVNRMLNGRRGIMAEEIPVIEAYLGQRLDLGADAAPVPRPRGLSDVPQADMTMPAPPALPDAMSPVPVRDVQGGDAAIDWTARHPAQAGIRQAFALYMGDDSMSPRYFPGEIIYVHPHRPAVPAQDVVLVKHGGAFSVCRLLSADAQALRVQIFNPASEIIVARSDIMAIYAIVGRG